MWGRNEQIAGDLKYSAYVFYVAKLYYNYSLTDKKVKESLF